jgi:hypothetical protein
MNIQDAVFHLNSEFGTSGLVNSSGSIVLNKDIYMWKASLIRGTGAIMSMTIIPTVSLRTLSNETLANLVMKCRDINNWGIPVLLNFAPSMNGNW